MKKNFKYGFTLGKFYPPHNGHLHLISSAKEQCEHLTVLVCTLDKETISGIFRYEWLKEIFKNENITFIHITDNVPQHPDESPDFWSIWTKLIKDNIHQDTEVFFSSELYGKDVAKHLNIKSICIDLDRKTYPISGTKIRSNPIKYWEFLHPIIRPFFAKRIVLTGPESTGKTTLAKQLADYYNTTWVDEYGREYCETFKPTILKSTDFNEIGLGQIQWEEAAVKMANKLLFCDTDLIVTQVYSEMINVPCPEWIYSFNAIKNYDLHLLLDVDISWEDDNTRIFIDKSFRNKHFEKLKNTLSNNNANYHIISGLGENRLQNAIKIVNTHLNL